MERKKTLLVIALLCIFVSAFSLLLLGKEISKRNRQIPFETTNQELTDATLENTYPQRINIQSININLPIRSVSLDDNNWEYFDDSVLYIKQSGNLDDAGNKIFYGHNFPNLLKELKSIKRGDLIEIFANSGKYTYKVSSISTVTADQTHILSQTNDDRITIFTCTGFLDSKRLVVTATKESPLVTI